MSVPTPSSQVWLNDDETIMIGGTIHFENVIEVHRKGVDLMNALDEIHFDLREVKQSDSSGLCLLTAWIRAAKRQDKSISIHGLPQYLSDLGRVSGLDAILPVVSCVP